MAKHFKNLRAWLIECVDARLSEVFTKHGFSFVPLPPDESNSDLNSIFPLGRLKRERNKALDIVEFQFDKYERLRFVINCGTVPENGVTLPWGVHLARDVADVSALADAYRLYSSPLRARWFRVGFFSPANEKSLARAVDKAAALSSEVIEWFESKSVGKHMRKFGLGA